MAERRMFARSIVLSDAFLDMPMSARCLYFTLGMVADDDGFVGSPKTTMRMCGASMDDLNILLAKRYLLGFESGVVVVKHWKINNYLQNDRKKSTTYVEEKETLTFDQKGAYTEKNKALDTTSDNSDIKCIQNGYELDTQYSIGKDSIGYNPLSESKDSSSPQRGEKTPKATKTHKFEKPSVEEVKAYCKERNNSVNAETFIDFYESKGWKVGNQPMKDWKAAVRTWERTEDKYSPRSSGKSYNNKSFRPRDINGQYDNEELEELTEL